MYKILYKPFHLALYEMTEVNVCLFISQRKDKKKIKVLALVGSIKTLYPRTCARTSCTRPLLSRKWTHSKALS